MSRTRRKISDLVIENHPVEYVGPEWMTLVQYINRTQLVIVDALDKNYLWGYNFDSMNMNEQLVFTEFMNDYWSAELYGEPIRIRIAVHEWMYDKGIGGIFGEKLVGYNINDILRLVGNVRHADPIGDKMHVKRRKRTLIKLQ